MNKILVVIPAFNEEANIKTVVRELEAHDPALDYIVVNDGSTDSTARLCREEGFNLLDLPVNLGLAGCFQAGMKYAYYKGYEAAIQFDGDGQHKPEYIKPMKDKMDEGYDIVIGSRFAGREQDCRGEKSPSSLKGGRLRKIGSRMIGMAIALTTGVRITDPTSGMRMFSRSMIREFALELNYGPEPDTISYLLKQGARIAEIPVVIEERTAGESYLRPTVAVWYMTRILLSILLVQNFRKRRA